ncbi:hypothetical protein BSKO_05860 [Bryopsis sp. KO-2023]|nr:hypothetical protein BSKO_05860 [Bryopsis sp. KO-2023]
MSEARVVVENVAAFLNVLLALKIGNKKICRLTFSISGFRVHWEDDSRSMQSTLTINPDGFREFYCSECDLNLGIQYSALLDTLAGFSQACHGTLEMKFPGPNNELLLKIADERKPDDACLYARINTMDADVPLNIDGYWDEPVSYFLIPGALLKEAIHDLEWPQASSVRITIKKDPKSITFQSDSYTSDLQIDFRIEDLSGFECHTDCISHQYHLKHLKIAFVNIERQRIPGGGTMSKVVIDSHGILKATHMLDFALYHIPGSIVDGGDGQLHLTAPPVANRWRPKLQFVMLPLEEENRSFGDD